jgi:hypothetical protein
MKKDEYIKDLENWQEKQYLPGEFLGSNVPPFMKYGSQNKKVILVLAIASYLSLLLYIFLLFSDGFSLELVIIIPLLGFLFTSIFATRKYFILRNKK